MSSRFSRPATALALTACLWTSAVAVVAAPLQQQTTPSSTVQPPSSTSQKKDATAKPETAKKGTTTTAAQTPAPAKSGQPLSTSEDPNQIGKRNINKGIIAKMSGGMDKEVAMGRQIAAEVDRQAKFIEDPVITEYVNRVGQNVVLHSDAKVPFTIKVIDSDEVNAFALPGGFFYVNKGLLLAADNEAELAGVMAHEIAHVAARHAVENQTKATITQYAILIPAIVLGGGAGQAIYQAGNFGALLGFMKFSRDAESEADRLGVQYLYAAGYDPSAMATMFEKLSAQNKKKPGALSKAFSTHPQPPDRRAASIALVARFPEREEYIISTSEFQRVKAHLLRLSNARATTAGNIAAGENGAPGRPTLKRRTPGPDDSTTTPATDDTTQPSDQQSGPPKLKRKDSGDTTNAPAPPTNQP